MNLNKVNLKNDVAQGKFNIFYVNTHLKISCLVRIINTLCFIKRLYFTIID